MKQDRPGINIKTDQTNKGGTDIGYKDLSVSSGRSVLHIHDEDANEMRLSDSSGKLR